MNIRPVPLCYHAAVRWPMGGANQRPHMTTPAKTSLSLPRSPAAGGLTELPDPPLQTDMATQLPDISRAHNILESHYSRRGDVVVMGNCYLCRDAGDVRRSPYPDLIVALDMPMPPADIVASNGYNISEIGKPPDFVLEVASQSTGRRDYLEKQTSTPVTE